MTNQSTRRTGQAFLWSAVGMWGNRVVTVILLVLMARLLEIEDFGIVAMAMVVVAFFQTFVEQGFAEAVIQKDKLCRETLSTAFWANAVISLAVFLLCMVLSATVAEIFGTPKLESVLKWLSMLIVLSGASSIFKAQLRRRLQFQILAYASLWGTIVGGIAGIAAAIFGLGVWALVIFHIGSRAVEAVYVGISSRWKPRLSFSTIEFVGLLSFGITVSSSSILNFINRYGADIIIGFYLGAESLGVFNLAFRLIRMLVEIVGGVVSQVSFSVYSSYKGDKLLGGIFYASLNKYIICLCAPLFLLVAVPALEIVLLFFGEKWIPAVPLMQLLAVVGLLQTILYANNSVLLGYGRPTWKLGIDCINATMNLILLLMVADWGLKAITVVYVIRGYLTAPLSFFAVSRLISIDCGALSRQLMPHATGFAFIAMLLIGTQWYFKPLVSAFPLLLICLVSTLSSYFFVIALVEPALLNRARVFLFGKEQNS